MINRILKIPVLVWHRGIAPWLPPSCRFYPSCGAFALEALDRLPWYRAVPLILWRLLRCNPFCDGGYDPVPGTDPEHDAAACPQRRSAPPAPASVSRAAALHPRK